MEQNINYDEIYKEKVLAAIEVLEVSIDKDQIETAILVITGFANFIKSSKRLDEKTKSNFCMEIYEALKKVYKNKKTKDIDYLCGLVFGTELWEKEKALYDQSDFEEIVYEIVNSNKDIKQQRASLMEKLNISFVIADAMVKTIYDRKFEYNELKKWSPSKKETYEKDEENFIKGYIKMIQDLIKIKSGSSK